MDSNLNITRKQIFILLLTSLLFVFLHNLDIMWYIKDVIVPFTLLTLAYLIIFKNEANLNKKAYFFLIPLGLILTSGLILKLDENNMLFNIFIIPLLISMFFFSLINHNYMSFSWLLVIVCIVTILVKLCLFIYTNKLCKKYNNILLEANSKDHKNDCIVTSFTLISVLATLVQIYWLDGIVGIGISIWIAITGFKIFMESYNVLMDKSLDEDTKDLILNIVRNYEDVQDIKHFYTSPVGYQYMVFLTICVDGNMSTFNSHELADKLEKDISNLDKIYHTIIHVNPI